MKKNSYNGVIDISNVLAEMLICIQWNQIYTLLLSGGERGKLELYLFCDIFW